MKKQTALILVAVLFVALLAGAVLLYDRLGETYAPEQLATQATTQATTQSTQASTTATAETTAPTEATLPDAPDFTVYDAEGNKVQLSAYFGKPIVLNFWASWCGPCQMEMPDFQEQYEILGEEVQFLMVNMTAGRETKESADAFLADTGYTFPVLYDIDGDAAHTYGAYSLPTTFFISAEGKAVAKATGAISGDTLLKGIGMIR